MSSLGQTQGETAARVPPHLRRFVVQQDYEAYTEVDHAVWRFVLLQMRDRLQHAAHPAYLRGLAGAGMSVERIPRIAEIDACLRAFGWGAVCVDGFIPPRAFQEFQARSILPIAAEIRCVENLPYTPAPDIIHEAAGHAPILADPEYAEFLRRIGACGMRAFASARDAELYDVIYRLSELKERRDASEDAIRETEGELVRLSQTRGAASEATRLSRLYWWTVEYGLVGDVRDYKLYGAGLLSSLGESFFCHEAGVRKLPLDRGCAEVDYDITRPQPQLFVVREFARLNRVLDEVCAEMAFRRGGLHGLAIAHAAGELATLELDSGLQATGIVGEYREHAGAASFVRLRGGCALGERDRLLDLGRCDELALAFGAATGPRASESFARVARELGGDRSVHLDLQSGIRLEGKVEAVHAAAGGELRAIVLREARARLGSELLWDGRATGRLVWLVGERVTSVAAGARNPAFHPAAEFPATRTPMRGTESAQARARRMLYERVSRARTELDTQMLCSIHASLQREQPEEWLLRWNLLESLERSGVEPEQRRALVRELFALERHFLGKYPIAMGLRFLGYATDPDAPTAAVG